MARGSGRLSLACTSSPVLVGRDKELAALLGSSTSRSTVVLLEDETGVGKTRLVRDLLAKAGLRSMVGRCQPLREPFPFGASIEALRSLTGIHGRALPMPAPALSPVGGALGLEEPPAEELGRLF